VAEPLESTFTLSPSKAWESFWTILAFPALSLTVTFPLTETKVAEGGMVEELSAHKPRGTQRRLEATAAIKIFFMFNPMEA
jgi:hypothetical protein